MREWLPRSIYFGVGVSVLMALAVFAVLAFAHAARFIYLLARADRVRLIADHGVVPLILLVGLAAGLLVAVVVQQVRSRTWRSAGALALFAAGAVMAIVGFASQAFPSATYPSEVTCIVNYDAFLCSSSPWVWSPVALALGVGAIALGVVRNGNGGH